MIDMGCKKGLKWKNVIGGKSALDDNTRAGIKSKEKKDKMRSKSTDSAKSDKKDKKGKKDKKDKDKSKSVTNVKEAEEDPDNVGVSVNCVKFIPAHRSNLFVSVDDGATMKVWDSDNGNLVAEEPRFSNGAMQTCAVEQVEGKLVGCGGLDGKVHIFYLNESSKKEDKTVKMIQKKYEFTGH